MKFKDIANAQSDNSKVRREKAHRNMIFTELRLDVKFAYMDALDEVKMMQVDFKESFKKQLKTIDAKRFGASINLYLVDSINLDDFRGNFTKTEELYKKLINLKNVNND